VHLIELFAIHAVSTTISEEEKKAAFGVRIFWGIRGSATDKFSLAGEPEDGNDLPHSTFTRRKRYRFDFDGESGNVVYFCLRYENGKGGKDGEGPFGPVFHAVIP
jgi:hypothetical protein